jgi:sulfite exporter TauE/SafE
MEFLLPAFALGLFGSLHCAVMCGPIALALPGSGSNKSKFLLNRFQYHLGRISTYALLGVLLGLMGSGLHLAGLQKPVSIAAGIIVLLVFFFSQRFSFSNPAGNWFQSRLIRGMRNGLQQGYKKHKATTTFGLGMLNGLLPCGLIYVALIGALALGDPLKSALFMVFFGIGTSPALFGISLFGPKLKSQILPKIPWAVPVVVVLFSSLLILRGLSLGIPYLSPELGEATASSCGEHHTDLSESVMFMEE